MDSMGDNYSIVKEDNGGVVVGFLSSQAAILETMFGESAQKRQKTDQLDKHSIKRSARKVLDYEGLFAMETT
jgi:hypothetical protein